MVAISSETAPSTSNPAPTECPGCGGPLLDLRHAGMNATALARDGICFLWADDDYQCAMAQARRDAVPDDWHHR